MKPITKLTELYDLITGDEDARVCKDIPDDACEELPRNFFIHLLSYVSTKIGDELASAKLILPWLLTAVGAPAFMAGFLVPIRQSGALLPQLVVAGYLRKAPIRKWFWIAGSFMEGFSILAIALAATVLTEGSTIGWTVIGCLSAFSLARGMRSVASKDVLGKTVSKARRGTLMGYATAIAGTLTVLVGFYAKFLHEQPESSGFFVFILIIASSLWLLACVLFTFLQEPAGATEGGGNALKTALENLKFLKTDKLFRHFVITRTLLLSTALSIPYYVVLAQQSTDSSMGGLGLLIIATGLASSLSAPIWGRFSDRSSRLVMVASAFIAAGLGILVFFLINLEWIRGSQYAFAIFFLILGIAHSGVRLGRKTYLVDMVTADKRAAYVAISNTVIGILILAGSSFGLLSALIGTEWIIMLLSIMAGIAGISALKLKEIHAS